MKKKLALLMAVALLLGCLSIGSAAFAAEEELYSMVVFSKGSEYFNWTYAGFSAAAAAIGENIKTELVGPAEVDPDLFAASLFVGSQWDNSILNMLEDDSFFYIVAAGDPKASVGQSGLMEVFDGDGAVYSHAEWSAQDDADTQNAAVEALLAKGNSANFVTFTLGSTTTDGSTGGSGTGEHMTSFDYAYKIEAVRDWLFEQVKA